MSRPNTKQSFKGKSVHEFKNGKPQFVGRGIKNNKFERRAAHKRKQEARESSDEEEDRPQQKKQQKDKQQSSGSFTTKLKPVVFDNLESVQKMLWTGAAAELAPSDELKALRKHIGVNVKGNLALCPPPADSLTTPGFPPVFSQLFGQLSYTFMTAVQKQCWPAILSGANVLAIAPTGSGKTYTYGLPMIPHFAAQKPTPQTKGKSGCKLQPRSVVLVPTRELALQVGAAFKIFRRLGLGVDGAGEAGNYHTAVVYGGANKEDQISELLVYIQNVADIDILVATPGRLLDLLVTHSHAVSLQRVTYFVLDEGDKMLDLGFTEQIGAIAAQIRPDRQTLLFSATFPGRLREVADSWMGDKEQSVIVRCHGLEMNSKPRGDGVGQGPEAAQVNAEKSMNICDLLAGVGGSAAPSIEELLAPSAVSVAEESEPSGSSNKKGSTLTVNREIKQTIHVCATHKKPRLLLRYIESIREEEKAQKARQPAQILVFCNKTISIGFVLDFLKKQNIVCDKLCGSMQQSMRERVLANFKAGKVNVVLATDVAARGIHIKRLKHVVNYDFPSNLEQYCHRVGRTGRDHTTNDSSATGEDASGSSAGAAPKGYAYSFFTRNLAPVANDLIALLEKCNQEVEPNLQTLATEYKRGEIIVDSVEQQSDGEGEGEEGEE